MRFGSSKKLSRRSKTAADNDAGHRITEIFIQDFFSAFGCLLFKISHFNFSDQLRTFKGKELIKTAELHTGPVQIRRPDIPFCPGRGNKAFQMKCSFKIPGRYHERTSESILKSLKTDSITSIAYHTTKSGNI